MARARRDGQFSGLRVRFNEWARGEPAFHAGHRRDVPGKGCPHYGAARHRELRPEESENQNFMSRDAGIRRTLYRATAGRSLESARQRALLFALEATSCDGYPTLALTVARLVRGEFCIGTRQDVITPIISLERVAFGTPRSKHLIRRGDPEQATKQEDALTRIRHM